MEFIESVVLLVFAVLQIILFFKIWGMTNDIKNIRSSLLEAIETYNINKRSVVESSSFSVGDLVVDKNDKQMRIKEISNGKYACYTHGGTHFEGLYEESDIKLFSKN